MTGSDALFETLSARARRQVLFLLLESESVQIPDAVGMRGSVRPESTQGGASPEARTGGAAVSRTKEIRLYHVDLPKLAAHGFIDWDRDARTVSRGENYAAIRPALETLDANASRFPPGMV